ncbi:MAG: hypothetical protein Q8P34_03255, partial [Bacteroidota bacterium]|nr:hypothetical protein [Bacteroidota bacterium]
VVVNFISTIQMVTGQLVEDIVSIPDSKKPAKGHWLSPDLRRQNIRSAMEIKQNTLTKNGHIFNVADIGSSAVSMIARMSWECQVIK